MSRPPIPAPPPSMADEISHLPTKSTTEAAAWLAAHGVEVTETYLTNARRSGKLAAAIVAGKRRYSTAELYRFRAAMLPPGLKIHAFRHTYASLCAAAELPVREVAKFMGHASPRTTETVYTHLFNTDDHASAMGKLGRMAPRKRRPGGNVVPIDRKTGA